MSRYYNSTMRRLRNELRYASGEAARRQAARIQKFLPGLSTGAVYPYEFVVEKITGFRPQRAGTVELRGETLIPDLLRLLYDISGRAGLRADEAAEKVFTLDEVCRRYEVSARTVARWRQSGLAAMKFIWPDGGRRTGFEQSALEDYVRRNAAGVERASRFSRMTEEERRALIERARFYAQGRGMSPSQVTQRLSDELGRSREAVRYTLWNHDRLNPSDPVFESWREPLTSAQVAAMQQALADGARVAELAQRHERTPSAIYQTLRLARARRLLARRIEYMPDPRFESGNADREILQQNVVREPSLMPPQSDDGLPQGACSVYGPHPLSREEEAGLFLRYNYLKFKAAKVQARLGGGYASQRVMDDLEGLLGEAERLRARLAAAYLRLVVSVAHRHAGRGPSLQDLISEGNLCLLRAIEKFDVARGNRFSTYLTWSLIKTFARITAGRPGEYTNLVSEYEGLLASAPAPDRDGQKDHDDVKRAVAHMLKMLSLREREVLASRFGLDASSHATYGEIGRRLGVTKERARQIHGAAIRKLREAALIRKTSRQP